MRCATNARWRRCFAEQSREGTSWCARCRRRAAPPRARRTGERSMKLRTCERVVFFYLPALVLVTAFVGVCVQAGTPWPGDRVVHEDGKHTFLETGFYFEHATRGLGPAPLLTLALGGAVGCFHP